MKEETILLLGKLHYAMADYTSTLARYEEANLDNISLNNVSMRKLKIIGEAHAIKGEIKVSDFVSSTMSCLHVSTV